ncbi:MAG: hypothetical protein HYY04_04305 [Chloroflexi bacterium]|nr:hypothetical protein [Chloroflexota bacterium]
MDPNVRRFAGDDDEDRPQRGLQSAVLELRREVRQLAAQISEMQIRLPSAEAAEQLDTLEQRFDVLSQRVEQQTGQLQADVINAQLKAIDDQMKEVDRRTRSAIERFDRRLQNTQQQLTVFAGITVLLFLVLAAVAVGRG